MASEILRRDRGRHDVATRAPWLVAFVFGLLHGFGFSGALREVGLPEQDIPLALLFFNVGVEGSLYIGAFAAAWAGFTLVDLPGFILAPLAFLLAGLLGAAWSLIPGYLRARLRVDDVHAVLARSERSEFPTPSTEARIR